MMERLLDKAYRWMRSFLIALLLPVLAGCRTQPPMQAEVTEDSYVQSVENSTERDSVSASVSEEMDAFWASWKKKLESMTLTWQKDEFSPPDSMGVQHKTSTVTGKLENRTEEESRDTSSTHLATDAVLTEIAYIDHRLERLEQSAGSLAVERKESLTWWQAALMWLGVAGVVYIGVRLVWRKLP